MCLRLKFERNVFNGIISGNVKNISVYNEQASH